LRKSLKVLQKQNVRARSEKRPVCRPGYEPCSTFTAIASPTADIAGALADLARGRGHSPGFADVAIGATARRHNLTILSRNERHFTPMDVAVVDPFQTLPAGK
jgi:hypothetical protein